MTKEIICKNGEIALVDDGDYYGLILFCFWKGKYMTDSNGLIEQKTTQVLIMRTADGWYPIDASGKKDIREEAADHGQLNSHITSIEDTEGNILWSRQ